MGGKVKTWTDKWKQACCLSAHLMALATLIYLFTSKGSDEITCVKIDGGYTEGERKCVFDGFSPSVLLPCFATGPLLQRQISGIWRWWQSAPPSRRPCIDATCTRRGRANSFGNLRQAKAQLTGRSALSRTRRSATGRRRTWTSPQNRRRTSSWGTGLFHRKYMSPRQQRLKAEERDR